MRTREEILGWMSADRSSCAPTQVYMPEELISGKVPLAIEDPEFCGIETESNFSCFCGFFPDEQACDFLMWYDPEWPAPAQRSINALYAEKLKAEDCKMELELMLADKISDMEEKEKKRQQKMISKTKAMKMELNKKDLFIWVLVGSNIALFAVLAVLIGLKM
uniref:Uncharacterized protein n=1 Tax=Aegilops tauschii TaxID=37682 RepID=N1QRX1_AEGTA